MVPTPTDYTVLIDYAHTPDALENILTTVRDFTPGRVICLFGCGGDRDRTKRPRMGAVAGALADVAVVTSDNPRTEVPMDIINDILPGLEGAPAEVVVEPDRRAAIRRALSLARAGDTVVLAVRATRPIRRWTAWSTTWTSGRKSPPISPERRGSLLLFRVETMPGL